MNGTCKILTTKTADQVRSKRRALRTANEEESLQEGTLEAEGGCDLLEPVIASAGVETCDSNMEMVHDWRRSLEKKIKNQTEVFPLLRNIYTRLNETWGN